MKKAGINFNEFADELPRFSVISSSGASCIDIVFNLYLQNSIRKAERILRSWKTAISANHLYSAIKNGEFSFPVVTTNLSLLGY